MSGETIVAKRYAKALFEIAAASNKVAVVGEQLVEVAAVLEKDEAFSNLLTHPNIPLPVKLQTLEQALQGKVEDAVLRTVQLLVERGRGEFISALAQEYKKVASEALGQAEAIVTTPSPLSVTESEEIKSSFGRITGKTIVIRNVVDPKLLGGLRVQIGDRLYDGSLSGKLERLGKQMGVLQAF